MVIVHRTFRTTFAEAAGLVRSEAAPSEDRVGFLADHIDFALSLLQAHHEGEDELLWPKLLERLPAEAETVQRVADQHDDVSEGIARVRAANAAWRVEPNGAPAAELADALDALGRVVSSHLDEEERLVLPLAARALTQEEWEAIGEHSRGSIPADRMFIAFGMILEPASEDDRRTLLSALPEPVQELWQTVGESTWSGYAAQLRPGG
jgi:hemerythrin-like domain-containing protein